MSVIAHAPAAGGELLDSGIALRDCTSFGLPGHVRLAAPKADEMKTVLKAIAGLGAVTGSVTRDLHTAAPDPTGGEQ